MLTDLYNRYFSYIRLSITESCNFNCKYCLPYKNEKINKNNQLSQYEIYNLMVALSELGVNKIRITGGEPTIRKDFLNICKIITSFNNIKSLVLTTNGYRLVNLLDDLYKIGINGINISLDSLNNLKFYKITNKNYFKKVYFGVLKALELNIETKVNIVLSDFFSLSDFESFYSLLKYKNISIRFINQMETNTIKKTQKMLNINYLINFLKKNNWMVEKKFKTDGPAIVLKNNNYIGKIGIINPYQKTFCNDCNRLRISSNGNFFLCLFGENGYPIKKYLNSALKKKELKDILVKNLKFKLSSHFLENNEFGSLKTFSSIGG